MPAYARTALFQLVARIQFVLRPAMLAQFDKSQCFSFPDKPAQGRSASLCCMWSCAVDSCHGPATLACLLACL